MSTEQSELNPNWNPPPQGGSGSKTVLLGIGIGCVLVVLLCCGGLLVTSFWFYGQAEKGVSTDPGTVNNVAAQITLFDRPDEFEPVSSFDLRMPFSQGSLMTIALFKDQEDQGMLALASGKAFNVADPQQIQANIRQSLGEQSGKQEELRQTQISEEIVSIRGKPCKFLIIKGIGQQSKRERIQAMGLFPGKEDQAAFFIEADGKKYPQQRILEILNSIQ